MSAVGVLGLIFVTLKLLAVGVVANWSWWLVLLPFYGGFLLLISIALFTGTLAVLGGNRTYRSFR